VTGIASLPMYDLPEVHWALDDLWAAIARHLERQGIDDVPQTLHHTRPLGELWTNPNMFISQCCGFDIVKNYTRWLQPLATPRYTAPGCDGCRYLSLVIVAEESTATGIEDLRGTICAVNGPESHSGMNTLRELIAPISGGRPFFAEVRESGAHANSVAMVASGEAQVAAIDNVTHAMLTRHRPAALAGTRALCETNSAPGIPFATRTEVDADTVERMRAAIIDAFAEPALAKALDALFMDGVEVVPHDDYYELIEFERRAVGMCYPKLQ
jgi:ABC-type phosphate/phosphonate transport system substrate-binding protein